MQKWKDKKKNINESAIHQLNINTTFNKFVTAYNEAILATSRLETEVDKFLYLKNMLEAASNILSDINSPLALEALLDDFLKIKCELTLRDFNEMVLNLQELRDHKISLKQLELLEKRANHCKKRNDNTLEIARLAVASFDALRKAADEYAKADSEFKHFIVNQIEKKVSKLEKENNSLKDLSKLFLRNIRDYIKSNQKDKLIKVKELIENKNVKEAAPELEKIVGLDFLISLQIRIEHSGVTNTQFEALRAIYHALPTGSPRDKSVLDNLSQEYVIKCLIDTLRVNQDIEDKKRLLSFLPPRETLQSKEILVAKESPKKTEEHAIHIHHSPRSPRSNKKSERSSKKTNKTHRAHAKINTQKIDPAQTQDQDPKDGWCKNKKVTISKQPLKSTEEIKSYSSERSPTPGKPNHASFFRPTLRNAQLIATLEINEEMDEELTSEEKYKTW